MIHEPTDFQPIDKRTPKYGRAMVRCPFPGCGKELPATPKFQCTGRAGVAIAQNLDCIHRLEKVGTVPCGTCRGKPVKAVVYGCRANGGQVCTLYAIGTGPSQQLDGNAPVNCATCPIRTPPTNTEG
jgi:hypothetical protein